MRKQLIGMSTRTNVQFFPQSSSFSVVDFSKNPISLLQQQTIRPYHSSRAIFQKNDEPFSNKRSNIPVVFIFLMAGGLLITYAVMEDRRRQAEEKAKKEKLWACVYVFLNAGALVLKLLEMYQSKQDSRPPKPPK